MHETFVQFIFNNIHIVLSGFVVRAIGLNNLFNLTSIFKNNKRDFFLILLVILCTSIIFVFTWRAGGGVL